MNNEISPRENNSELEDEGDEVYTTTFWDFTKMMTIPGRLFTQSRGDKERRVPFNPIDPGIVEIEMAKNIFYLVSGLMIGEYAINYFVN